ncbi:hypothetical protein [Sphingomonas sp. C3-2]|uniref:hypothetical protein n=1 Tax=Sphingomonas sp. C3-2 TaxID=3062169 RepID=UPI00294B456D|nr:hypothetical protein [Sphingomonas sp. C3-2]WOK37285.1 hypothetical protein QYC26_03605 [Sphingomonas sp. C3-2]
MDYGPRYQAQHGKSKAHPVRPEVEHHRSLLGAELGAPPTPPNLSTRPSRQGEEQYRNDREDLTNTVLYDVAETEHAPDAAALLVKRALAGDGLIGRNDIALPINKVGMRSDKPDQGAIGPAARCFSASQMERKPKPLTCRM